MIKKTLISLMIFLLTSIIYSQDIINETGNGGKFIVRDAELNDQLRVNNGNVEVTGKLKIEEMSDGTDTDDIVVWDKEGKSLKVIPRAFFSILSTETASVQFGASSVLEYIPGSGDLWRTGTQMNLIFESDGGTNPLHILTGNANPALATKLMTIRPDGNVGIGTTTPLARLHVIGNIRFGASSLFGYIPGSGDAWRTETRMNLVFDSDGGTEPFYISTGNANPALATKLMTIRPDGNVGIGTISPLERLHVIGNIKASDNLTASHGALASLAVSAGGTSNTNVFLGASEWRFLIENSGGRKLHVYDDANNLYTMTWAYGGNIGINNINPSHQLDVNGNIGFGASSVLGYVAGSGDVWRTATRMNLVINSGGGTQPLYISTGNADPAQATKLMTIQANGKVGIGTTSPQGALDIDITSGALIVPRMSTIQVLNLPKVNGSIVYNTTSNKFNFYENDGWVTK
jgi:hypothetical protein